MSGHLECAGKAQRRRRFGLAISKTPELGTIPRTNQSNVALGLATALQKASGRPLLDQNYDWILNQEKMTND